MKPKGSRSHQCLDGIGWIKTDVGTVKTEITAISANPTGNSSKSMAERNSKAGIQTKIEEKINIAIKDGERTELYVSSFFDE